MDKEKRIDEMYNIFANCEKLKVYDKLAALDDAGYRRKSCDKCYEYQVYKDQELCIDTQAKENAELKAENLKLTEQLKKRLENSVQLPCKVGDTVYYPFASRVIEKRVSKYIEILRKSKCVDKWYCVEFSDDETFDEEDVGKTVFLTRAEAEAALKGSKGESV